MKRVRLRLVDIASHCGVSKAAVARALNRPVERSELRPETWARIRAAARQLGYRADWRARALAGGPSHTIGLLYDGIYPPLHGLPGRLVCEIARWLAVQGYDLLLVPIEGAGWRAKLDERRCDVGVVVGSAPLALEAAGELPLPLIAINASSRHASVHILPDDRGGATAAVRHLIALGHRRIAYLGGIRQVLHARHASQQLREEAYSAALRDSGLAPRVLRGDHETMAALSDQRRPSAILAYSDQVARWLMQVARERGLRVPEDLSVVGFNDDPESALVSPPLTTVALPIEAIAHACADRLRALVAGDREAAAVTMHLPETLLVRGSTASA